MRWFRSRQQHVLLVLLALVATVVIGKQAIEALSDPALDVRVTLLVLFPSCLVVIAALRSTFLRLGADRDEVVVVNLLRTHHIPWGEIESFSVGRTAVLPRAVLVNRRDGTVIGVSAIQPPNIVFFPADRTAHSAAEELNTLLDVARASGAAAAQS